MTYNKGFGANEETTNQTSLAQSIQEQTDLIANEPQRQDLKLMLVGSPEAVRSGIHYFHVTGHAETGEWSPLQHCPNNQEEMMSILIRKITVQ